MEFPTLLTQWMVVSIKRRERMERALAGAGGGAPALSKKR